MQAIETEDQVTLSVESRREVIARLEDLGNVSGSCTNAIFEYLNFVGTKSRIPEILARAEEYGAQQKTMKLDPLKRYPISEEMALIFAAKDVLDWGDEEVKELGRSIPRVSLLVKMFLRYFLNLDSTTRQAKKYWDKHYDFGEINIISTDIESDDYTVEVTDFDIHPVYCVFLCGFLETMIGFVQTRPVKSWVIRCSSGDGINKFGFGFADS